MGCNCGGGGMSASRLYPSPAKPAPGETWEVTYPDGTVESFRARWQAEHATSVKGGSYRRITTGPRP